MGGRTVTGELMNDTAIIGVWMTLKAEASDRFTSYARLALADTSLEPATIRAVVFSNSLAGELSDQPNVRAQIWFAGFGFGTTPIFNVDAACAGAASALHLAIALARTFDGPVLAVASEQRTNRPRARSDRPGVVLSRRNRKRVRLVVPTV
jgi:3-oxoacyl-[acyl-carrier-protein] synthase III